MILLFVLSVILMIFSYVLYRQRQYRKSKAIFALSAILMIVSLVVIYWASTQPYPMPNL